MNCGRKTLRSVATRLMVLCLVPLSAAACASVSASVQLAPDERTIVHLGEIAALPVPPNHGSPGLTQTSMALVSHARRHGREVYFYRAIAAGNETFVVTPVGLLDGQCISCVTVHYFVTVVP